MVEKVIPGGVDPEAESSTITLDGDRGLIRRGKNRSLRRPRLSFPGVELREFAIGLSADEGVAKDRLRSTTVAENGSIIGVVVREPASSSNGAKRRGPAFDRAAIATDSACGSTLASSRRWIHQAAGKEYSGILDLKVGEIRITAIGMLVTDPFSFVVILAIFAPAIELSFGFTLGLGGLLAINRTSRRTSCAKASATAQRRRFYFPKSRLMRQRRSSTKCARFSRRRRMRLSWARSRNSAGVRRPVLSSRSSG
jgi:hypothetical protein